jgi:hypothetical protein
MVAVMLTISRLKRFSIAYYNETVDHATQAAMDKLGLVLGKRLRG